MNNILQNQVMDETCLAIESNELHPIFNIFDEAGGRLNTNEFILMEEMLFPSGLSFGKELESFEALIGGMELFVLQDDITNLNFSACSVGCAGNCSGSCSATCSDSCFSRCKSSYNS
jgi:hypothetical protein